MARTQPFGAAASLWGWAAAGGARVTCGSPAALQFSGPFTLEMWSAHRVAPASADVIVGYSNGACDEGYSIRAYPSGYYGFWRNHYTQVATCPMSPPLQWQHICALCDGTNVYLASNGVIGAGVASGGAPVYAGNAFNWLDGPAGSAYEWTGGIWGLRAYSRMLLPTEVDEHYRGIYRDESGLVGKWLHDEGIGTTITDTGGGGLHGTITGTYTWEQSIPSRRRRLRVASPYAGSFSWAANSAVDVASHVDFRPGVGSYSTWAWFKRPIIDLSSNQTIISTDHWDPIIGERGNWVVYAGPGIRHMTSLAYEDGNPSALGVANNSDELLDLSGWHLVVAVMDRVAGAMRIYMDANRPVATAIGALGTINPPCATVIGNTNPVVRGASPQGFDGLISEVGWLKGRAITWQEIRDLYFQGAIPAGTTSFWPFNEGAGNTIHDIIGGHDGTATAMGWSTDVR